MLLPDGRSIDRAFRARWSRGVFDPTPCHSFSGRAGLSEPLRARLQRVITRTLTILLMAGIAALADRAGAFAYRFEIHAVDGGGDAFRFGGHVAA